MARLIEESDSPSDEEEVAKRKKVLHLMKLVLHPRMNQKIRRRKTQIKTKIGKRQKKTEVRGRK